MDSQKTTNEPWNIPNAKLGVGAVVLNQNSVLLVRLNYGPAKGLWILPGGRVESGEHLESALHREVLEETGVHIQIDGLLTFRQRLKPSSDANPVMDVYFVFRAHPVGNIQPQQNDQAEISEVKFWDMNLALASTEVRPTTKYAIEIAAKKQGTSLLRNLDLTNFGIEKTDHFYS